jgi:hypothetical protein
MISLVAGVMLGVAASMQASPPTGGLTVHEWGTFTTFAGPDGTPRRFQTAVGAELPEFVFSRALQAGNRDDHDLGQVKFVRDSLVRMETPVLYFYAPAPMSVDVEVRMPDGSLTEFYPPVTAMEPAYMGLGKERVSSGMLAWRGVKLIPGDAGKAVEVPAVEKGNHYGEARAVDAATVEFNGVGGTHHERFLFYRGIADFDPAVRARALGDGKVMVTNQQADAIPAAFLVEISGGGGGGHVRFVSHGAIAKDAEMTLPPGSSSVDELSAAVERSLVNAGLYAKEAAAMVATWRSSWFAEEGTRVLYILPERVTDAVVPLKVTPAPASTVRVFVGRAEVLTPEVQAQVERELGVLSENPWNTPTLKRLGRFSRPVVECVETTGTNEAARATARGMMGR